MAYAIAYCIHTLEMSALRGWGVAFLGYVATATGAAAASILSPAVVATGLGLIGTFASVAGNEAAIRYGRKRLIVTAMVASILIGANDRFRRQPLLCTGSYVADALRHRHLARLLIAHGRNGRHRRAIPAGCNARGAFHAWLCGRLCRTVAGRTGCSTFRGHVTVGLGNVIPFSGDA